jgi:uncharacterized membrane protein (Fun14 family)
MSRILHLTSEYTTAYTRVIHDAEGHLLEVVSYATDIRNHKKLIGDERDRCCAYLSPACSIPLYVLTDYAHSRFESLMVCRVRYSLWKSSMDPGGLATLLATQIGLGGTLGFLLGYGLKKIAAVLMKILALVAGLFALGLTWLASIGVITVNFNAFTSTLDNSFTGAMAALISSFAVIAQVLPIGGSFGLGFYLGAKKG